MKYVRCASIVCAALLSLAVGCSSDSDSGSDSAETTSSATSTSVSPSAAEEESDALAIDVTIQGGTVTPTNERFDATVGEPITLRVDSDSVDELHVHSVPDHSFEVAAEPGQVFEFTVDVPGSVAIELHDAGRTIATLAVRP